ncbi:MAG: hypothetical protein K2L55_10490 [Muribaculaceae bacterium]|nr:hypothetical protein [Muribaculaceae bacterium]
MVQFKEKEIEKLAAITGTTPLQISKLIALGVLDESKCLDALLIYDFRRLKRRGIYKVAQIFEALMERYKVPKWRAEKAVYYKVKKKRYCKSCQKEISGREYVRGNGKCDQCVAKEIDF